MTRERIRRLRNAGVSFAYLLAVGAGFLQPVLVRADALINYGGSSVAGEVEEVISLPGITVGGSDPTIPVVLDINDPGGILYMEDETGLSFSSSNRSSRVSFSGSVSDINNALSTLKYRTLSAGSYTLTATIVGAGVVYNPNNGHLYEVVNHGSSLSWDDAQPLAASRTMNGATGYLATVTTQAENDYLLGRLSGDGWFGASDSAVEGDWRWVTGPEAGTSFWAGLGDGAAVGGLFSNWAGSEPNDSGGDEDCAQFYSSGSGWNDLPCGGPFLQYYVVEYGGPGDMPTAPDNISFTVNVTEPASSSVPIGSCLDLINVAGDPEIDQRYNTLTLTSNVDCTGETLEPMFNDVDLDFGVIGFSGVFDGNSYTLSNVNLNYPGDNNVGLFSSATNAEFRNLTLSGDVIGNECVGGLVGYARNSDFSNNTMLINVSGYGPVGGMIGCAESVQSTTNDIELNIQNGAVTGSNWAIGGLVGDIEADDESTLTISENTGGGVTALDANGVGGIVGNIEVYGTASVTIDDNAVTGSVNADGEVGGLVGYIYNDTPDDENVTLSNNMVDQNVSSDDGDEVGGLVGYAEDIYIYRSSYNGDVVGLDDEVGGLIGESDSSTILESYSDGTVSADDSFAGGLVGRNSETTITRSFSLADVQGYDRVGGLVGANGGYITDSYARGNVTGYDAEIGGLAGRCGREITNSYATGLVTGPSDTGGLLGYSDGCDVVDSFWDTETTAQSTSGGDETDKTTAQMKKTSTYLDTGSAGLDTPWNFASVWQVTPAINDGYPCLQWQSPSCETDDGDGITNVVENSAPNSGDANDDGIPDSSQNNVTSFVNPITSEYVAVVADPACSLTSTTVEDEASQAVSDSGYNYASGLVNFSADCGTPGYTTTVRVIVYNKNSTGLVLRKHNPNTNAYFTITTATISDVTIGGVPAVEAVYQIVDGGELDIDGTVNGEIVDPVGLAVLGVGSPNTGFAR